MQIIWMFLTYLAMLAFHLVAEWLPLNGMTANAVNKEYQASLLPADFGFIIWGVICLALFISMISVASGKTQVSPRWVPTFITSNFLSIFFTISWHYNWIFLSVILLFLWLIAIYRLYQELDWRKKWVRFPISLYLGGLSVSLLIVFDIYLAKIHAEMGNAFPILLLLIGFLAAFTLRYREQNLAYPLAVIWLYVSIFFGQLRENTGIAYVAVLLAILLVCTYFFRRPKVK
ncbi:hypothetical protein HB912_04165 [Listeria aquatica]|uniref:Tryptophan-rich sensory protein n=1 Tax=Listeria aquatica TaxID=1494960 RepID=A0A841ZNV6_9LIST|nr:hypothetical protein [Listeria aquatica]MBC1520845.1 hypothetical protein [Listeria aquatica]